MVGKTLVLDGLLIIFAPNGQMPKTDSLKHCTPKDAHDGEAKEQPSNQVSQEDQNPSTQDNP